ncbi:hypothetical protein PILCRDRAFT_15320 [Piloderma croceum F 1598]|uniref:Uncharacterized protein n=1 Tax=Piloderma croceum (strain F 1598) TaxID=765440 RepID=A0A0C3F054_PILCF|nr:hypothetical protein PILCRDRAFT_15320 [Piloderma croceum F 1598]
MHCSPAIRISLDVDTKPTSHLPQNASNPTSILISNKSYAMPHASAIYDRDSANYLLAQATDALFLGAMPPKQFLDEFFLVSPGAPKCPNWKAFASVCSADTAETEINMYASFLKTVVAMHSMASTTILPDVGVYAIKDQLQRDARTDFSKMDLLVEFKIADTSDPLLDPEDPLQPKAGNFRFEND